MYEELAMYIDGEWCQGSEGAGEDVVNPATEEVLGRLPHASVADLDRDGRRDVLCAVKGRDFAYLRATGEAARPWQHHAIKMPPGCGTGKGVAVCDVDGDGRRDLVFSCENAGAGKSGMRWLSYDKMPTESTWRDHEISGPAGIKYDRLELLDLDADGDLDVITCEESDGLGVVWYENPTRR